MNTQLFCQEYKFQDLWKKQGNTLVKDTTNWVYVNKLCVVLGDIINPIAVQRQRLKVNIFKVGWRFKYDASIFKYLFHCRHMWDVDAHCMVLVDT